MPEYVQNMYFFSYPAWNLAESARWLLARDPSLVDSPPPKASLKYTANLSYQHPGRRWEYQLLIFQPITTEGLWRDRKNNFWSRKNCRWWRKEELTGGIEVNIMRRRIKFGWNEEMQRIVKWFFDFIEFCVKSLSNISYKNYDKI